MPKASVNLPDGTQVSVEGSEDQIARLLALYKSSTRPTPEVEATKNNAKSPVEGPLQRITNLVDEGFFVKPKTLGEIREKLREQGFIYKSTHLSPTLLRLVKKKVLRRIREDGSWKYINP